MSLRKNKKKSIKEAEKKAAEVENEIENPVEEVEASEEAAVDVDDNQKQINELKDKYLRLFAEFENYKKRAVKDKLDLMRTAAQDTLSALLPVMDDFDRARNAAEQNGTADSFNDGIGLIIKKLRTTLGQKGLKAMESNGELFDAELHEAIAEIPAPSKKMKGHVIDTVERGYYLSDKIIRHAKVVVGK